MLDCIPLSLPPKLYRYLLSLQQFVKPAGKLLTQFNQLYYEDVALHEAVCIMDFFFYKCSPNALLNDLKEYKVSHNSVRISYDILLYFQPLWIPINYFNFGHIC